MVPTRSDLTAARMKPLNVAIVFDFLEENWPSMERVGRTIFENVREVDPENLRVSPIRPRFVRRFTRAIAGQHAFNADRVINRMVDYPQTASPASRPIRCLSHRGPQLRASGACSSTRARPGKLSRSRYLPIRAGTGS